MSEKHATGSGPGGAMSFRQVNSFVVVAACRSITAAASQLHVAQSALSRSIQALEQQIGEPLFERHTQGLKLTSAGEVFLPYAHKIIATYTDAVGQPSSPQGSPFQLAGSNTILPMVLPPLLERFRPGLIDTTLIFRDRSSGQVLDEVCEGKADAGLCMVGNLDKPDPRVALIPLLEAPIGLLGGPGTVLPGSGLTLDDLAALRFVRLSDDMVLPCALAPHAALLPAYFGSRVVSNSMPALFSAVASGSLVTLVSAVAASMPLASGLRFYPLPALPARLNLCLVHRPGEIQHCWLEALRASVLAVQWHEAIRRP